MLVLRVGDGVLVVVVVVGVREGGGRAVLPGSSEGETVLTG